MKSKKAIITTVTIFALTLFGTGYANLGKAPFPNMPKEVQNNLYYFLSVVEYKVTRKKAMQATITVKLTSKQASVMTDRPYRKTVFTPIENFIRYIKKEEKNDLNLTLMIHGKDDVYTPLSFEQDGVTYSAQDNTLTFQATLLDSTAVQQWAKQTKTSTLQGRYTTLMVEG